MLSKVGEILQSFAFWSDSSDSNDTFLLVWFLVVMGLFWLGIIAVITLVSLFNKGVADKLASQEDVANSDFKPHRISKALVYLTGPLTLIGGVFIYLYISERRGEIGGEWLPLLLLVVLLVLAPIAIQFMAIRLNNKHIKRNLVVATPTYATVGSVDETVRLPTLKQAVLFVVGFVTLIFMISVLYNEDSTVRRGNEIRELGWRPYSSAFISYDDLDIYPNSIGFTNQTSYVTLTYFEAIGSKAVRIYQSQVANETEQYFEPPLRCELGKVEDAYNIAFNRIPTGCEIVTELSQDLVLYRSSPDENFRTYYLGTQIGGINIIFQFDLSYSSEEATEEDRQLANDFMINYLRELERL